MPTNLRRLTGTVAAAALTLTLFAAPSGAADGHRHRHHHRLGTPRQWVCVVRHGWGPNVHLSGLRDPATRARFVQTLRECRVLPPAPGLPTTTTTTTAPGDPIRDT